MAVKSYHVFISIYVAYIPESSLNRLTFETERRRWEIVSVRKDYIVKCRLYGRKNLRASYSFKGRKVSIREFHQIKRWGSKNTKCTVTCHTNFCIPFYFYIKIILQNNITEHNFFVFFLSFFLYAKMLIISSFLFAR